MQAIERPEVQQLIPLVTIETHAFFKAQSNAETAPDLVIITLKNGRTVERAVDKALGMAECPLSRSELMEKFNRCAGTVLSETRARQVQGLLQDFAD